MKNIQSSFLLPVLHTVCIACIVMSPVAYAQFFQGDHTETPSTDTQQVGSEAIQEVPPKVIKELAKESIHDNEEDTSLDALDIKSLLLGTCGDFPEKLIGCEAYTCEYTYLNGEPAQRIIQGPVSEGICIYIDDIPGDYNHVCKFPEQDLEQYSSYYNLLFNATNISSKIEVSFGSEGSSVENDTVIDGKKIEDLLLKANQDGICFLEAK